MAENPQSSGRQHEIEIELQASPDEVWRSITEADRIQEWFAPDVRVTPGLGGSIYVGWGPGMGGEAPIRIWEPGKRLGWVQGEDTARQMVVTFEIIAGDKEGTSTLRLVQSGFGAGADFDAEYDSTFGGWHTFLAILRAGLGHFPGVRGTNVTVFRMSQHSQSEAWVRMQRALAISSTEEGSHFQGTVGALQIAGKVTRNPKPGYLCLALNDSVLGVFVEGTKEAMVTIEWIFYGPERTGVQEALDALVNEVG